jgi:hypothetical protein
MPILFAALLGLGSLVAHAAHTFGAYERLNGISHAKSRKLRLAGSQSSGISLELHGPFRRHRTTEDCYGLDDACTG